MMAVWRFRSNECGNDWGSKNKTIMKKGYFITGTDTAIGKTFVTCTLLQAFTDKGHRVGAMKPIAAGCEQTDDGWRNDDALLLLQYVNVELSYEQVNPVALPSPIAPHLAVEHMKETVTINKLTKHFQNIKANADYFMVEGAGGWQVPLNDNESMADIPQAFGLDVILVVGIRLGCLNHALLSTAAIEQSGNHLAGWVANIIDPNTLMIEKNILTLKKMIGAPLLGVLPHMYTKEVLAASQQLDVELLLTLSNPA